MLLFILNFRSRLMQQNMTRFPSKKKPHTLLEAIGDICHVRINDCYRTVVLLYLSISSVLYVGKCSNC